MGDWIDLTAADGHSFSAYICKSEGQSKGGVVLVQEIFGVNDHIQALCERYAKCGYTAIAPALFDRLESNVALDYDSGGLKKGLELKHSLDDKIALLDIGRGQGPHSKRRRNFSYWILLGRHARLSYRL